MNYIHSWNKNNGFKYFSSKMTYKTDEELFNCENAMVGHNTNKHDSVLD